jgi:lipoprotein NlpI
MFVSIQPVSPFRVASGSVFFHTQPMRLRSDFTPATRFLLPFLLLFIGTPQPSPAQAPSGTSPESEAIARQQQGVQNFFAAKIDESIADFDAFLAVFPEQRPHHWQRGISLYYADRFVDGKKQFEIHQNVNSEDVENAVWHFLCASKIPDLGVEHARKHFIPITKDSRIPLKEVHALFAGDGSPEEVLKAAQAAPQSQRDNALCYAHLYLGLYYEALEQPEKSLLHIRKAALDYTQPHYMGEVARVHLKLRTDETDTNE